MKKVYSKKQSTAIDRFLPEQFFVGKGKGILFLVLWMLISSYSFAQDAFTVTWPLTSDGSAIKTGSGAVDVTTNNVYIGATYLEQTYGANGLIIAEGRTPTAVAAGAWTGRGGTANANTNFTGPSVVEGFEAYETTDMYVEFSITAGLDKDLKVNNINIPLSREGTGQLNYNIAYSLDGFTIVNYMRGTNEGPTSTTNSIVSLNYTNEIVVPKGKTLALRFMVWRRNTANVSSGQKIILGKNVVISGVAYEDAMPVSLTTFTGKKQSDGIVLNWSTASEKDNSHFDILRSVDGKTFDKIDRIKGSGTSEKINRYTYTDTQPLKGTTYYQLRQVDFNGDSELSNIISVDNGLLTSDLQAFVTADGQVVVIYQADRVSPAQLSLYDISGRRIINHLVQLQKGNNQIRIPVNLVNRGGYIIKIKAGETEFVTKFLK
ncbi:T9SS type A sorting domain-containing protein [Pseudopedobacter beijingensis]|uniref:T9SS type A sorting domain-containing protein n=1 Tax=Pseudopedobacter beijingensis TaxID=1207056 RepID=A0ABW4I7R2_9SPHI